MFNISWNVSHADWKIEYRVYKWKKTKFLTLFLSGLVGRPCNLLTNQIPL